MDHCTNFNLNSGFDLSRAEIYEKGIQPCVSHRNWQQLTVCFLFFDRCSFVSPICLDDPKDWSSECLSIDTIIDMWELNHVKNPAMLMEDLGFNEREINLSRLLGVIDEELQNIHNDREFTPLLRVCICHLPSAV